ncbi:hypothetical protein BB560_001642 [Smittium megazygosporum]|uniref:HMG box domain-containing protein n=1 Tax=Smittium megazygosporum TaxID=133381 RepID=A0A2T9ZH09_9FUNG|nr:hypothetical protein BB560_001642 [Smittium megazygosporum]
MNPTHASKPSKQSKKPKTSDSKSTQNAYNGAKSRSDKPGLTLSKEHIERLHCIKLQNRLDKLEKYNERVAVLLDHWQHLIARLNYEKSLLFENIERRGHIKIPEAIHNTPISSLKYLSRANQDLGNISDDDSTIPLSLLVNEKYSQGHPSSSSTPSSSNQPSTKKSQKSKRHREKHIEPEYKDTPTSSSQSDKKHRTERDPDAPKRPANPFVMYCQDKKMGKAYSPDSKDEDQTKNLNTKWKELPPEEKKKYYDKYKSNIKKYLQSKDDYESSSHSSKDPTPPSGPQDSKSLDVSKKAPFISKSIPSSKSASPKPGSTSPKSLSSDPLLSKVKQRSVSGGSNILGLLEKEAKRPSELTTPKQDATHESDEIKSPE